MSRIKSFVLYFTFLSIATKLYAFTISDLSYQCMCESFSGCDVETNGCVVRTQPQDLCGPHQISRDYWTDAGLDINNSELGSYLTCTRNLECSEKVIERYIGQRIRDCDGNGRIDSLDIGLVHFFGPECDNSALQRRAEWIKFKSCNSILKPPDLISTNVPTSIIKPDKKCEPSDLDGKCVDCICQAYSGCQNNGCFPHEVFGKTCGVFHISPSFWRDSLKEGENQDDKIYEQCVANFVCSKAAVVNYYKKFHSRCNVLSTSSPCERLFRLHTMGLGTCSQRQIGNPFMWKKIENCYNS